MNFKSFSFAGRMDHLLLDPEAWEEAHLCGAAYVVSKDPRVQPRLGLVFRDREKGRRVFNDLLAKVGPLDDEKRVRVSIVEGEIPQCRGVGHALTVGPRVNFTARVVADEGAEAPRVIVQWYRAHVRLVMESPGAEFRSACERHGRLVLFPISAGGHMPDVLEIAMTVDAPEFRRVEDVVVGESDPDEVIFQRPRSRG